MAYTANALLNSDTGPDPFLRVEATSIMPKTFAIGSGTLAPLTPVAYNTSTNQWVAWGQGTSSEVISITAASTTATDGTFTLTLDGEETGDIDHDAIASAIKTAIIALDDFTTSDVTVQTFGSGLGTNSGGVYIYFLSKNPAVSITTSSLTGNAHTLAVLATDASEISTITANATTATDGTFTITVNGETTSALAHDAVAATIEAALIVLGGINAADVDVVDFGGGLAANSGGCTIIFKGALAETSVDVSVTLSLTGNVHVLATMIAGAAINGASDIKGFIWPDSVTLSATGEVIANVLMSGKIHYDDIPLVSGQYVNDLKEALRTQCRALGIIVQGLDQVR
jgi:ribosomal protein S9